jgi:DNA-directed RNA polymerase specialized sigma24 family protein
LSIGGQSCAPLLGLERYCYGRVRNSNDHAANIDERASVLDIGDEDAFEKVYTKVLPKVIQAARRRFGERIRWYSAEDAAASAVRTVYRRLKEQQIEGLTTWKDLEDLLVTVAYRKYVNKARRASVESRARDRIAAGSGCAGASSKEAPAERGAEESRAEAVRVVELLHAVPKDGLERLVLCGKLDGESEQMIADQLAEQSGEPWSKYMVRRTWEKIRVQFIQRATIRFGLLEGGE